MILRLLTSLLVVMLLCSCFDRDAKKKAKANTMKDQSGDVAFQSFVGRLQIAVAKRDVATLSALMAPGFGYRWDAPPPGETPFIYWDRNNLWGELAALVRSKWVPHEGFMVVPAQLAEDPNYGGYRAGVRMVNGAWRLAYFVPAPPLEDVAASPAPTAL